MTREQKKKLSKTEGVVNTNEEFKERDEKKEALGIREGEANLEKSRP